MIAAKTSSLLLDVKNVTVTFGGLNAVDGARLALEDNQLLGFIGPNGAGKTTLLNVLAHKVQQSSAISLTGHIFWGNQEINHE